MGLLGLLGLLRWWTRAREERRRRREEVGWGNG